MSRYAVALLLAFFLAPATVHAQTGDHYALLVGVQDYDGKQLSKLRFARADVLKFASLLKKHGFPAENVEVMHDDARSVASLRHLAEASKIRQRLRLVLSGLQPADTVVIVFSGHGVQRVGETENYFCPVDADLRDLTRPASQRSSLVSLSEVYQQLAACKAGRKLLLADACRNQPVLEKLLPKTAGNRRVVDLDQVSNFAKQVLPKGRGMAAIFSCSEGQESLEDGELGHGVFLYHAMKAWAKDNAAADGRLDFLDFANAVRRQTRSYALKLNRQQTPHIISDIQGRWVLPLEGVTAPKPSTQDLATGNPLPADSSKKPAMNTITLPDQKARTAPPGFDPFGPAPTTASSDPFDTPLAPAKKSDPSDTPNVFDIPDLFAPAEPASKAKPTGSTPPVPQDGAPRVVVDGNRVFTSETKTATITGYIAGKVAVKTVLARVEGVGDFYGRFDEKTRQFRITISLEEGQNKVDLSAFTPDRKQIPGAAMRIGYAKPLAG